MPRRTKAVAADGDRYRTLVECSPCPLYVHRDGIVLFVNPAAVRLFGATASSELVGTRILDRVHPPFNESATSRLESPAEGATSATRVEMTLLRLDGTAIAVEIESTSLVFDGAPASLTAVSDISARKLTEQRLTQVMAAVETTSDAIGISDAHGRHVYQNKALSDLFGYATAEELEAAGGGPACVKDPAVAREMFDSILHGGSWVGELEMVTKSGRVFPAFECANAILDGAGNIAGVMGIITDFTERKNVEDALRLFKDLVQHSSDAIGMATPDGRHYYQNEAFGRLLGDAGTLPAQTLYVDKGIGKQVFDTIKGGGRWQGEVEMWGRDRAILNISLRAFAIKAHDGRVLGIVGLHTDVTERKRVEAALRESEERYRAIIAHMPMGMHRYDLEPGDRLVFAGANLAADRILTVDHTQFVGKTIEEAFPLPARQRQRAAPLAAPRKRDPGWAQASLRLRACEWCRGGAVPAGWPACRRSR